MNILNICNNPDILSSMRIVRTAIIVIRLVVPIILIVSIMISYVRAVKDNDSAALNKANKSVVSKSIAAILVFFIPTFVNLIAGLVDVDKNSYISCIQIATKENINRTYYEQAYEKMTIAKKTLKLSDYNVAVSAANEVKDDYLSSVINAEIARVKEYMDLKDQITVLKGAFDKNKFEKLYKTIDNLDEEEVKEVLLNYLSEVKKGRPLDIDPGIKKVKSGNMEYYQVIPPNPTTNMPLVIFLHGDGGFWKSENVTQFVLSGKAYTTEEFIYIAPSPVGYSNGNYNKWNASWVKTRLKELIEDIISRYECDESKIIIMGYSFGAIGVWDTVSANPNFFSAAVPVSCGSSKFNAESFYNTAVWAISGDYGDETIYGPRMEKLVNQINSIGGHAKYTKQSGKDHGDMAKALCSQEIFTWALSQ